MSADETSLLIQAEDKSSDTHGQSCCSRVVVKTQPAVAMLAALPKGAGSWYATFGSIAMIYHKEGLWLLGPVGAGGVVALTDEALKLLVKKHPDNRFLNSLADKTYFSDVGIGGFMADFGFAWGTLKAFAGLVGGIEYLSNDFAKIFAPMIAFPLASLNRYVRFNQSRGDYLERCWQRHLAHTIRGATSTGGITGTLTIQGILAPTSWVPTALMVVTGLIGGAASFFKEKSPRFYKILMTLLNLLAENPSLAMTFFALPNDVYAGANNGEIPEEFFYSNVAISSVFLVLLTMWTLSTALGPEQQQDDYSIDTTASTSSDISGYGSFFASSASSSSEGEFSSITYSSEQGSDDEAFVAGDEHYDNNDSSDDDRGDNYWMYQREQKQDGYLTV